MTSSARPAPLKVQRVTTELVFLGNTDVYFEGRSPFPVVVTVPEVRCPTTFFVGGQHAPAAMHQLGYTMPVEWSQVAGLLRALGGTNAMQKPRVIYSLAVAPQVAPWVPFSWWPEGPERAGHVETLCEQSMEQWDGAAPFLWDHGVREGWQAAIKGWTFPTPSNYPTLLGHEKRMIAAVLRCGDRVYETGGDFLLPPLPTELWVMIIGMVHLADGVAVVGR